MALGNLVNLSTGIDLHGDHVRPVHRANQRSPRCRNDPGNERGSVARVAVLATYFGKSNPKPADGCCYW